MLSMKKHHGLKPQSDRFFLSHQPTCTTCGSTSTMVEMRRFYVKGHYNGNDDEVMPTDHMRQDFNCGKECIACRASETMRDYQLWPPEYQRKTIVKTAARSRAFFNIMSESGNPVTDPQKDFVQFLKDITKSMVGNIGVRAR